MNRTILIEVTEEEYEKIKDGALREWEGNEKADVTFLMSLGTFPLVRELLRRTEIAGKTSERTISLPQFPAPVQVIEGALEINPNVEIKFTISSR